MCGIVGIVGTSDVAQRLFDGLLLVFAAVAALRLIGVV